MNFKSIGLAGLAAATFMTAAPANASSIANSKLAFGGGGRFTTSTGRLDFSPLVGAANFSIPGIGTKIKGKDFGRARIEDTSKGYFDNREGEQFRIKDLSFTTVTPGTWTLAGGPISEFFKFKDGVTFTLNSFNLEEILNKKGKKVISGDYTGVFLDKGNQFLGLDGLFSSQNDFILTKSALGGDSYSSSIKSIPSPALIPGLLGLGIAALRKRKSEESDVEAAETAKA